MRAAAFCTCSRTLLTDVPGLYHAAAHHVNRGSTTASTSHLTYFAFNSPRLFASSPTPTSAFDAFDAHDAMCSLKSTTFGSSGERSRAGEKRVTKVLEGSNRLCVHVRFNMKDSVHRQSERDYRVFGRSTWSGAEVVGREELERVCEMSRYNLVTKAERGSEERDEAGLGGTG
ncbi:hypothetical protein NBRC10512_005920 [Rhodotorula toruloides]